MTIPMGAISEALDLLPDKMDHLSARRMMVAIGFQESGFVDRYQIVDGRPGAKGPARGLWQFERLGGVRGVLMHPSSSHWMRIVCHVRNVNPTPLEVWEALETDDVLAAAAARLLLWTDPKPMPADEESGWDCYLNVWRPGKPHRERWGPNWRKAQLAIFGEHA